MRFIGTFLAVLSALFVFFVVLPLVLISIIAGMDAPEPLPGTMVLTLDLRQSFADAPTGADLPSELGGGISVVGIVDALESAAKDGAVKGLYLRGGTGLSLSPAQAEEVRGAIDDFRASGKFVVAHVQDLFSVSIRPYHILSVADELWLQPSGAVLSQGLGTSRTFFKKTLDLLDSSAQVQHYYEYKTAMHAFLHDDFTEPQLEEETRLLQSIYNELIDDIAKSRGMSQTQLTAALDRAPLVGEEAVDAHIVDKLGYDSASEDSALAKAGDKAELVPLAEYFAREGSAYDEGEVIAFINGSGPIVEGEAEVSFFGGSDVMASDTISRAIREAGEDEDVKAILFRVNSPGGSAIASDQIWQALEEAQANGKPVIINMSTVAASGGYWVAMGADKIVAEPTTITGSIGVVGGKLILKGAYEKVGVNVGELSVGTEMAHMFSDQHPFSEKEWLALTELFDNIYGTFTQKVAEGRGLPLDTVKRIARGRVWSGADAHERKLVDAMGGFKTALALAKEAGGIAAEAPVELRAFPKPLSFYEQIATAFGGSAEAAKTFASVAEVLQLEPVAEFVNELKAIEARRGGRIETRTDIGAIE